jgi:hypothetical protein
VDLPNTEARQLMIQHYLPPVVIERPALLCQLDYGLLAQVCFNTVIVEIETQVKMVKLHGVNKGSEQSVEYWT